MYDYTRSLTTSEVMDLSPEEKEEYIRNRKAYRRWRTKMLKEQMVMGIAIVVGSIIVLTGASVVFIPLGLWEIWCAAHNDIVIC